jgi:lipoate---protein ligase
MGAGRVSLAAPSPGRGRPALGAVPGRGFLTAGSAVPDGGSSDSGSSGGDWFDVDRFRSAAGRVVVVRPVDRETVVLGSGQLSSVVDAARAAAAGVAVTRRRSGGGAVHVGPDDPVWVDVWVPRGDPLWHDDVLVAPLWAGEWWRSAVATATGIGPDELVVHRGRSIPARWSSLICFAGVGPGEVTVGADGKKVVGLAQWRSRQGALVHGGAYGHWDPRRLVDLLAVDDVDRPAIETAAADAAAGLDGLVSPAGSSVAGARGLGGRLVDALLDGLPGGPRWEIVR